MNKRAAALVFALAFSVSEVTAQASNTLHNFMMANPLIAHPDVFRELQANISSEIAATEPGAKLDEIYKIVAEARSRVLNAVHVELFDTTNGIGLRYFDAGIGKCIVIEFPPDVLDNGLGKLQDGIESHLERLLTRSVAGMKERTRSSFLFGTVEALKIGGIPLLFEVDENESATKTLAKMVARAVREQAQRDLELQAGSSLQDLKRVIIESGNRFALSLRTRVGDALTTAEQKLREVVGSFSKTLMTANSGLSVTEGMGSFEGGLHLSFRTASSIQFGVYISGQFNKSDSTLPTDKLLGGQLSLALSDRFQFDLLASALFRGSLTQENTFFEGGIGLLYRPGNGFLVSTELFRSKTFGLQKLWILGLGFRGVAPDSPSLFIGWPVSPAGKMMVKFGIPILAR